MFKISRRASVNISLAFTVLFFAVIVLLAVIMPSFVNLLIYASGQVGAGPAVLTPDHKTLTLLGYAVLLFMTAAIVQMFILLLRVRDGKVFTDRSVGLIRGVSWCCIAIGVLFCVIGLYFILAVLAGCAALFLGLCLRVVKNVVEEATAIKAENDLTV